MLGGAAIDLKRLTKLVSKQVVSVSVSVSINVYNFFSYVSEMIIKVSHKVFLQILKKHLVKRHN